MARGIKARSHDSTTSRPLGPDDVGDFRKAPRVVSSPRQLLVATAVALAIIAWYTPDVDRSFLFWPWLWVGVALVCSVACLLAAVRPRRLFIAVSGATLVTSATGRGLAIVFQAADNPDRFWRAEAVIAMFKWWGVAVLGYVVWREYVLPWSVLQERQLERARELEEAEALDDADPDAEQ